MKILKKIFRLLFFSICFLFVSVILLVIFSVAPLNRTPVSELPEFATMMTRLDSLNDIQLPKASHELAVGFSEINITPDFKTATAGYGKRKGQEFTSVRDSVYVRTIVIDNGTTRVAIVSADLLIIPPAVTEKLNQSLPTMGFLPEQVFLGASHTHNGIGNWGHGVTQILYGKYKDEVVNLISNAILKSIKQAASSVLQSRISVKKISIPERVDNRLIDGGNEDPFLRMVQIERADNKKLLLLNYTAHATCLYAADVSLSGDYPGTLVKRVADNGYDFVMFMAGAVGSHSWDGSDAGDECINSMAGHISARIHEDTASFAYLEDSLLYAKRVPLALPDPQVKLFGEWKARAWLFRAAFGEYPAYLSTVRIGDLILLGTPCDYSGEFMPAVDSVARDLDRHVMVSSFNGGYIGYVTPIEHYDVQHYETQLMNWYPPGTGDYMTLSLQELLLSVSKGTLPL